MGYQPRQRGSAVLHPPRGGSGLVTRVPLSPGVHRLGAIEKPPPTVAPSYGFCLGCHRTHYRAGDCADQVRADPLPPPNPALSNPIWKEGRPTKGLAIFLSGPFEVIDTWDFSFWRWLARLFVRRDEFPRRISS